MTTAAGPEYVPPTDWSTYRACPVCRAATGVPCVSQSSRVVFGRTDGRTITLVYSHTRRPLRSPTVRQRLAAAKERIRTELPHGPGCPCVLCNPTLQACAACGQPVADDNCPDECNCTTPGAS